MKNITVSVDDDLSRRARGRAARELRALFADIDASLTAQPAQPIISGWRDAIYDERFNASVLGPAIAKQGK